MHNTIKKELLFVTDYGKKYITSMLAIINKEIKTKEEEKFVKHINTLMDEIKNEYKLYINVVHRKSLLIYDYGVIDKKENLDNLIAYICVDCEDVNVNIKK